MDAMTKNGLVIIAGVFGVGFLVGMVIGIIGFTMAVEVMAAGGI